MNNFYLYGFKIKDELIVRSSHSIIRLIASLSSKRSMYFRNFYTTHNMSVTFCKKVVLRLTLLKFIDEIMAEDAVTTYLRGQYRHEVRLLRLQP
jgi:hypothetical protein